MNLEQAVKGRRSIRKFADEPIPRESVEELLTLACAAPSGKNRQPWRFLVLTGDKKQEVVNTMRESVQQLIDQGIDTGSARWSVSFMEQAPVNIFVYNAEGHPEQDRNGINHYAYSVDIQSIGGAIQTLLLAAYSQGLGSLWICDVFYAECQISAVLSREDELVAAIALGYPAEEPSARPRKTWSELTTWY